jgi:hypothetical protein
MTERAAPDWVRQLAELVLLVGCAYIAAPEPKPKADILPVVVETEERSRQDDNLSPEVREFMRLPLNVQKQVLDYARTWIDAHFERVGRCR